MANLGKKYTCYSCHTKFYDLGKPLPICPKCGANQHEGEETPSYTGRGKSAAKLAAPVIAAPEFEEPEEFPAEEEGVEALGEEEPEVAEELEEDE
ncbi:MAG: FYDLN acid domain-containing protein [Acidobacteriota bacterium]